MTFEMGIGIALFAVFALFALLMYLQKLPALLALPLMAAVMFLVGDAARLGVNFHFPGSRMLDLSRDFITVVIEGGMVKLWGYMITVLLGAMMAELLKDSGVSKAIVRWASELGGDNKFVACFLLMVVTAALFTTLGGLGAVIMVATIVLPVLLGIGVAPAVAGAIFLFGLSLGGAFNLANWQFYIKFMKEGAGVPEGLGQEYILKFVPLFVIPFVLTIVLFLVINTRRGFSSMWALFGKREPEKETKVNPLALLAPVVPIALVLGYNLYRYLRHSGGQPMQMLNTALLIGVLYTLATTSIGRGKAAQRLTKALFEGISGTAPVAGIVIGIGMIIAVVQSPAVKDYIQPILQQAPLTSPVAYIALFGLLAPLAMYRGPLNVWGMGIGIATVIAGLPGMPPAAVMGAFYSVGMIQGVCDPTNTHNVWIANFVGVDVQALTKKTLLYMWGLAIIGLVISAVLFLK